MEPQCLNSKLTVSLKGANGTSPPALARRLSITSKSLSIQGARWPAPSSAAPGRQHNKLGCLTSQGGGGPMLCHIPECRPHLVLQAAGMESCASLCACLTTVQCAHIHLGAKSYLPICWTGLQPELVPRWLDLPESTVAAAAQGDAGL